MALLHIEGLEINDSVTQLVRAYPLSDVDGNCSRVTGYLFGYALQLPNNGTGSKYIHFPKATGSTVSAGIIGWYFKYTGSAGDLNAVKPVRVYNDTGGGYEIYLQFETSGAGHVLKCYRQDGTLLATGTTVLAAGSWYHLEFGFAINNTNGQVDLRINGTSEFAVTSLDTCNTGDAHFTGIELGGSSAIGSTLLVDHAYVMDTLGATHNTFKGPRTVRGLRPNGDGNYSQWVPNGGGDNYVEVDDTTVDDDSSFVSGATAGVKDTYTMEDLSALSGTIDGISVKFTARLTSSSSSGTVRPLFRQGTTDDEGSDLTLSSSTYSVFQQIHTTNPDTATAWTVSEINALELGLKLQTFTP
jgi:hypothetical protein